MLKRKILFLSCGNIKSNATVSRLRLAAYLNDSEYEIHLCLEDHIENKLWVQENIPNAISHYVIPRKKWSLILERRKIISEIEPDFVHVLGIGFQNVLSLPLIFRPRTKPKYILDFDELKFAQNFSKARKLYYQILQFHACRVSYAAVGASQYLNQYFLDSGWTASQLAYLPYAYEPREYEIEDDKIEEIRAQYLGKNLIVYMGNWHKAYQSDRVLELAHKVFSHKKDSVFLMIGGGPELAQAKQWVSEHGLTDGVFIMGYLPERDMNTHLLAADVLLFPIADTLQNRSRCPNKTFQYVGAKRPIVTNEVGEVRNALGNEAFYFDFESLDSFEGALDSALSVAKDYDGELLANRHTWKERATKYQHWLSTFH